MVRSLVELGDLLNADGFGFVPDHVPLEPRLTDEPPGPRRRTPEGRVLGGEPEAYQVTGIVVRPCTTVKERNRGSPASRRPGNRRSRAGNAIRISIRARGAPRQ